MSYTFESLKLENVFCEHISGNIYSISIPGLIDESPRLIIGDRLVIEVTGDKMEEYHVFVHSIRNGFSCIFYPAGIAGIFFVQKVWKALIKI